MRVNFARLIGALVVIAGADQRENARKSKVSLPGERRGDEGVRRALLRLQALLVVAEPVPPRVDAAIADEALWIVARRYESVRRHLCRIAKAAVTHEAVVGETTRPHHQGAARRQNTFGLPASHVWGRRTLLRACHEGHSRDAQDSKGE